MSSLEEHRGQTLQDSELDSELGQEMGFVQNQEGRLVWGRLPPLEEPVGRQAEGLDAVAAAKRAAGRAPMVEVQKWHDGWNAEGEVREVLNSTVDLLRSWGFSVTEGTVAFSSSVDEVVGRVLEGWVATADCSLSAPSTPCSSACATLPCPRVRECGKPDVGSGVSSAQIAQRVLRWQP
eukprot:COSAG05_NODE_6692_length_919_cov_4.862195_1_plen_179_part_00